MNVAENILKKITTTISTMFMTYYDTHNTTQLENGALKDQSLTKLLTEQILNPM